MVGSGSSIPVQGYTGIYLSAFLMGVTALFFLSQPLACCLFCSLAEGCSIPEIDATILESRRRSLARNTTTTTSYQYADKRGEEAEMEQLMATMRTNMEKEKAVNGNSENVATGKVGRTKAKGQSATEAEVVRNSTGTTTTRANSEKVTTGEVVWIDAMSKPSAEAEVVRTTTTGAAHSVTFIEPPRNLETTESAQSLTTEPMKIDQNSAATVDTSEVVVSKKIVGDAIKSKATTGTWKNSPASKAVEKSGGTSLVENSPYAEGGKKKKKGDKAAGKNKAAAEDWQVQKTVKAAAEEDWQVKNTVKAAAEEDWQVKKTVKAAAEEDWQVQNDDFTEDYPSTGTTDEAVMFSYNNTEDVSNCQQQQSGSYDYNQCWEDEAGEVHYSKAA